MTPFKINLLLHFYCMAEPYPNTQCKAFKIAIDEFLEQNLIRTDHQQPSGYGLTVVGEEMVKRLKAVKVPRTHIFFVDDAGEPTRKVGDPL